MLKYDAKSRNERELLANRNSKSMCEEVLACGFRKG